MKKTPQLDFAKDRAALQRWHQAALSLLGLAVGLQFGIAAWRYQTQHERLAAVEQKYRQAEVANTRSANAPLSAAQAQDAVRAHAMLAQLSVPWEDLLSAIEAARTLPITIEALQPQAQEGTVSISATAADFSEVAGFIQRLEQQEKLHHVVLLTENRPGNSAGMLRFTLSAHWRQAQ